MGEHASKRAPSGGSSRLPQPPTTFIGRQNEITEIEALLESPECRLLTIVGPGGVGKTRLALELASGLKSGYAHGACFVDLSSVQSSDFLLDAVADAFGFSLTGREAPRSQVSAYLAQRNLLLILDNFENLVDARDILPALLDAASEIKILVTSRQVLDLLEEWVYPLSGLDLPPELDRDSQGLWESGAIRLFLERAKRANARFEPKEVIHEIARICSLVDGRPLAIELAAVWVRTLSPAEIAAEINSNLGFLSAAKDGVPERHHSMRVVFDHSWKLLNAREQAVFRRLSVFQGGFDRPAAESIAGATLPALASLVDKSLLRRGSDGRYYIHELSRQYAREKLGEAHEEDREIAARHSDYYVEFLSRRSPEITGERQVEAVQEIKSELDNVRAAWNWAVRHEDVPKIRAATESYVQFCDHQGRYLEAQNFLDASLECLDSLPSDDAVLQARALLLSNEGYNNIRLGLLQEAQVSFRRSRQMYAQLGADPPAQFGSAPMDGLAMVAYLEGDYPRAVELGELARAENEDRGDIQNLLISEYVLTDANLALGDDERARTHAFQGLNLTQETGNRWMRAYFLNLLGRIERDRENLELARRHYQASYEIKNDLSDPGGVAASLIQLGSLALLEGDHHQAGQYFERSKQINYEINDRGGLVDALNGLGRVAILERRLRQAYEYLRRGLEISLDMHWTPRTLTLLTGIAEVMVSIGQPERAAALLALVCHDPAASQGARQRAEGILSGLKDRLSPLALESALAQGQGGSPDRVARAVLSEFGIPGDDPEVLIAETRTPQMESDALIEQLTPREHEVLTLIAGGLTNRQIAERLVIAIGTVKSYTSNIYAKLDVANRTQAVARGRELGLLV